MRFSALAVLCAAAVASAPPAARAAPEVREDAQPMEAGGADDDPVPTEPGSTPKPPGPPPRPPRIDGPYLGLTLFGSVSAVRVNTLDTAGPFSGFGGYLRFGQMVLPWLGFGLRLGGGTGYRSEKGARQSLGEGGMLVDFNFVPLPKRLPLTLLTSFGFGGGAVTQEGTSGRSGFGGSLFGAAVRYEFFPGVMRYRPDKGGGFGLGPELGWLGATPAAPGRPMAHRFYLGLSLTGYFGD